MINSLLLLIIVILSSGFIFKVDAPPYRFASPFSSFHRLAISPDEDLVAFYLDSSVLWVTTLDMTDVHLEVDLTERASTFSGAGGGGGGSGAPKFATLPSSLEWLDSQTVALLWKNFVVIVDMEKNVYEFFYPSFVRIQPEVGRKFYK